MDRRDSQALPRPLDQRPSGHFLKWALARARLRLCLPCTPPTTAIQPPPLLAPRCSLLVLVQVSRLDALEETEGRAVDQGTRWIAQRASAPSSSAPTACNGSRATNSRPWSWHRPAAILLRRRERAFCRCDHANSASMSECSVTACILLPAQKMRRDVGIEQRDPDSAGGFARMLALEC
jgi:hypothetical protein